MNEIIYKYLGPKRVEYLENELISFTTPKMLNDPFECYPGLDSSLIEFTIFNEFFSNHFIELITSNFIPDYLKRDKINNLYKKYQSSVINVKSNFETIINNFNKLNNEVNSQIGILSLSRNWSKTLMWSHYAESHQGFVIGFNSQHEFFKGTSNKMITELLPVTYNQERTQTPLVLKNNFEYTKNVVLLKHIDWKYEEEERMIGYLKHCDKVVNVGTNNFHLFKLPHDAIEEIIIGYYSDKNLTDLLTDFALKRNIQLYRADLSKTKFDMERVFIK